MAWQGTFPLNDDVTKIEVIRVEDLKPGDLVLVGCPEEKMVPVAEWCQHFFKGRGLRTSAIPEWLKVQIISPPGEEKK